MHRFLLSMPHDTSHLIRWATRTHWAMEPMACKRYYGILTRSSSNSEIATAIRDYRAVQMSSGPKLDGSRDAIVRDNTVAVIPVRGPIFRYSDMFTAMSGGATIEGLARDLALAMASPQVRSIVLHVDSPGGDIVGVQELASHIAAARGIKPVIAYGEGMMCSAAMWLAAPSRYILAGRTSINGSIGVYLVADTTEDENEVKIVADQSPNKVPDLKTEEGRKIVLERVNDLCDVFVDDMARYRGVSTSKVLADFGQGGVLVGRAAVTAGLIDGISTLEGVISGLAAWARRVPYYGGSMDDPTLEELMNKPAGASAGTAQHQASEREQELVAKNALLEQRLAAIEKAQTQAAEKARTQAIAAASEAHIKAGRFDPEHRAALEGVYGAVYGTPQQAELDSLLASFASQEEGEKVASTPVSLDRSEKIDYEADAAAQVGKYNKQTGVK